MGFFLFLLVPIGATLYLIQLIGDRVVVQHFLPGAERINAGDNQAVNMLGQFVVGCGESLPAAEKIQTVFICCDMQPVVCLVV